jgi:hypothetical protein
MSGYAARMDKQRLLAALQEFRAELADAEDVDAETLERLDDLTRDIEQKMTRGKHATPPTEATTSGLKELMLKFEADHPQLSASVGRVADALAAMGF